MTSSPGPEANSAEDGQPTEGTPSAGLRRRIVSPTPPAPVPERRAAVTAAPAPAVEDRSTLRSPSADENKASDREVVKATGNMAIATLLSRITGFLRQMLIGATLGTAVGSAFGTANQIPNLITEIVLGAVLTSLVIPVLVRAEKEDSDHGEGFIRRLFTMAFSLLGVITILAVIFAPFLTRMMLPEEGQVNSAQATTFAYLLLPQIFFYGLFALFQAVLNTRNVFGPAAWAPVINNVISISVLLAYQLVPGRLYSTDTPSVDDPHVLLLALGTTLGVAVQAAILLPYLKKARINLRPQWGIDARLKQFSGMAVAIIAYVAISQLGYVITSRVAASADEDAPLLYQNAWLLLQVPYGVIGVTLLTAIMPRLSRNAADGDDEGVVRDLTLGTKLTFIALIPIVIFMTGFGVPIARGLFQYIEFGSAQAELLGLTVSFSAFTLIPYALVLLHLRVFYAREEAWTPTFIIAGITFTKIVLTLLAPLVANSPERVVILLGTANGFGFIAGAVIGAFLLRRKLGSLGGAEVIRTTLWATISAVIGLAAAALANWLMLLILPEDLPSVLILVRIGILGLVFIVATGIVLSRSGLPEVLNLGRALQRVPGFSRFINVRPDEGIAVEEPELAEIQPIFDQDAFNSSPVPPPMSAGIVRGPRLVPGAPVSDGRFRLLRDHGSVPGARFWQAREQDTGRTVALTFVDTTGNAPMAPVPPAESARRSAQVSRATRKLGELGLDSVASNIEILSYRSGCLVVADWIEGNDLKTVASSEDLDPQAVAHALAPLFSDTAKAHEAHLIMGLDNRNRIRISTDGTAVLAFPAVLEDATEDSDREALSKAIDLLVESTSPTPQVLRDIAKDASVDAETAMSQADEDEDHTAHSEAEIGNSEDPHQEEAGLSAFRLVGLAQRLSNFADGVEEDEVLPVVREQVPEEDLPEEATGFGSRGYTGSSVLIIGVSSTLFVVLMAALTTWILSVVSGDAESTPVSSESIQGGQATVSSKPPIMLQVDSVESVPSGRDASAVLDPNSDISWTSKKTKTGLFLTINKPAQLRDVLLSNSGSAGAGFHIYGLKSENFDPTRPNTSSAMQLADGTLSVNSDAIDLTETAKEFDSIYIEFTELPKSGEIDITKVQLTGVITSPEE